MKLLQTKEYLILIDEEAEVCRGQYRLLNDKVELIHEGYRYPYKGIQVIAYYPLTSETKELDLPLLPPFEEVDIEKVAKINSEYLADWQDKKFYITSFIEGYKAAQSKQLELLKRAIQLASDAENIEEVSEEIIQSLSAQQTYPKEFIPEYEYYYHSSKEFYTDAGFIKCSKEQYETIKKEIPTCPVKVELKTITNSEGKEEIQGRYGY